MVLGGGRPTAARRLSKARDRRPEKIEGRAPCPDSTA